jgi:hypothetical protein
MEVLELEALRSERADQRLDGLSGVHRARAQPPGLPGLVESQLHRLYQSNRRALLEWNGRGAGRERQRDTRTTDAGTGERGCNTGDRYRYPGILGARCRIARNENQCFITSSLRIPVSRKAAPGQSDDRGAGALADEADATHGAVSDGVGTQGENVVLGGASAAQCVELTQLVRDDERAGPYTGL